MFGGVKGLTPLSQRPTNSGGVAYSIAYGSTLQNAAIGSSTVCCIRVEHITYSLYVYNVCCTRVSYIVYSLYVYNVCCTRVSYIAYSLYVYNVCCTRVSYDAYSLYVYNVCCTKVSYIAYSLYVYTVCRPDSTLQNAAIGSSLKSGRPSSVSIHSVERYHCLAISAHMRESNKIMAVAFRLKS